MPNIKAKCKACGAEVILKVKIHEYTKEATPYWLCPNGHDGKHTYPIEAIGSKTRVRCAAPRA